MTNREYKLSLLIALTLLLLSSCGSSRNFVSSSYTTAFDLMVNNIIGNDSFSISKETIDSIPYASLLFRFDDGNSSLLILESINQGRSRWISADKKTITIQNGRILETFGLPNDLYSIERPKISFKEIIESDSKIRYISYYSYKKPDLTNLKVEVEAENLGLHEVHLFDEIRNLILIEENLYSNRINWHSTNRYWVDPVNFYVWKSEQDLSSRLPSIHLQITKKPAI